MATGTYKNAAPFAGRVVQIGRRESRSYDGEMARANYSCKLPWVRARARETFSRIYSRTVCRRNGYQD